MRMEAESIYIKQKPVQRPGVRGTRYPGRAERRLGKLGWGWGSLEGRLTLGPCSSVDLTGNLLLEPDGQVAWSLQKAGEGRGVPQENEAAIFTPNGEPLWAPKGQGGWSLPWEQLSSQLGSPFVMESKEQEPLM